MHAQITDGGLNGHVPTGPRRTPPYIRFSRSAGSPRVFGLGFLQTPPRDDALALLLSFGSAITWSEDFHLTSYVPCLAHTSKISGAAQLRPLDRLVGRSFPSYFESLLIASYRRTSAYSLTMKCFSCSLMAAAPINSKYSSKVSI
jgi:hypothetical protein